MTCFDRAENAVLSPRVKYFEVFLIDKIRYIHTYPRVLLQYFLFFHLRVITRRCQLRVVTSMSHVEFLARVED